MGKHKNRTPGTPERGEGHTSGSGQAGLFPGRANLLPASRGRIILGKGKATPGSPEDTAEEGLALEVARLSGEISGTAVRILRGEIPVTPGMRKEIRRIIARLGQLNATLVGRFPARTDLLEQVSEAYLDAMFILGGGKGPSGTRLQRIRKDGEPPGKAREGR